MAKLAVEIDPRGARTGARVVRREMADIERSAERVDRSTARMGQTANDNLTKMARGASVVGAGWRSLIGLAAGLASAVVTAFSTQPLFEFKDALAEVSTLVDTATFDMRGLEQASLDQLAVYGGSAAGQARAFYQIISAGASDAASATETLNAANKLAIGGVTDVATAADGLTSVLNAYGSRVESAAAVSDSLFVGMRAGKTTIGELSSSLGKVAPLAAQTGVSFDELVASISALTKGGIATTEAVTGVRAILAAVAKPTKEARDLAGALGLEFNAAALESKGLAGFLTDLTSRTGGSTEALSQLFGGVEALVPIMALSGQAGQDFVSILEQMESKAGSTEDAFNKMANSPGFQAGRVWASLQAEVLGASGALSGPLTAALKAVADNMGTIITVATIFTAGHLAAAILPVVANILTMASALGTATVAARALSVAMAFVGGPIGLAVGALAAGYLLLRDNVSAAEQAAREADSAYMANSASLDSARNSSVGFTNALRNQIAMQVQAAKASLAQADAQLAIAKGRASGFRETFGFGFQPLDYAADQARIQALELDGAYQKLEMQLAEVDAGMKEVKVETQELGAAAVSTGAALKGAADSDPWKGLRNSVKGAKEEISFAQSTTKGFLSDLRQGLRNGESFWESFGNAALNVLDKIIDKVEDQLVNALFSVRSAGSGIGGGGGGFLGGIFGAIGKLFGFAQGGVLEHSRVTAFASGGVVSKPTLFPMATGAGLMGEAGPEAIMPLKRAPNGDLGVQTSGSQQQTVRVIVESVARVDEDGNWHNTVEKISEKKVTAASPRIVRAANQQVLPTIGKYQGQKAGGDWRNE
jgi:TP901 family phage tail tape measure protein